MEAITVRWLPGAERVTATHQRAGQQLDDLCAVHWGSILLTVDGFPVDPEELAVHARTLLPPIDPNVGPGVGRSSRLLPVAVRPEEAGTSLEGLMAAVANCSDGSRVLVPLRTDWSGERVMEVLHLCRTHPDWQAAPLANVQTGSLWGSRLSLGGFVSWLAGDHVEAPPPDWDVGHFVSIAGTVEGSARTLLIVRDSYPQFGWDGHHLQPPEAMAAALRRDDGREGGIVLYLAASVRADVERAAKEGGFDVAIWDNGTPWLEGGGND